MVNWKSALPEDVRAKIDSFSDDADGLSKLANSFIETKAMVGGRIPIPDPADITGMEEIFNKLGRPQTFDGYDIKNEVGEGEYDLLTPMLETFHAAGVNNIHMQNLIDKFQEVQAGFVKEIDTNNAASREKNNGELKTLWGDGHDEKRAAAVKAAESLFGEEYAGRLDGSTDINAFIGFDKLAAEMSEHGLHGGDRLSFKLTPGEAKTKMNDIRGNLDHPFHKGDQDAVAEMASLTEAATEDNQVLFEV
ncbi:MAG: hypothetical protein IME93_03160 [Proteobacteria bacterium]|nr:hypothetical protein [Pseudomonadota bacterium]